MKRLFGKKSSKGKKRISPSATAGNGLVSSHPAYQYALNEYAQTVPPASSNDDGRSLAGLQFSNDESTHVHDSDIVPGISSNESMPTPRTTDQEEAPDGVISPTHPSPRVGFVDSEAPPSTASLAASQSRASQPFPPLVGDPTPETPRQQLSIHQQPRRPLPQYRFPEPTMPDATYEEWYGDAYVGGPIRYIYPSGYQSMRPRGGPWKLSIAVCLSFTWLSVFVIGHCSDRADQDLYKDPIDDDSLAIETRWCGSRMLYLMWVGCMLITGLATAYCSIIGYIKVRDFAVANTRSQPPGMVGRSDYYISIDDNGAPTAPTNYKENAGRAGTYQHTIYQSDGTPQFWGGHIYRPTQAAVAITSR